MGDRAGDAVTEPLISRGTYYRWLKEAIWWREQKEAMFPVQSFEALQEERGGSVFAGTCGGFVIARWRGV